MIESTVISRELGAKLRECRERANLRTVDVARKLDWTSSKVSRLESGDRRCDPMEYAMLLGACEVPGHIAKPLLKLATQPETGFWTAPYGETLPDELLTLVMNETTASTIFNFEPCTVPGLLQTPRYAAEVMRSIVTVAPEQVQARVDARAKRQELLSRRNPPQMHFYLNEAVLRCPVGGPSVMNEQLLHLVFAISRPQTTVRVVPTAVGAHAGMRGAFMFMGYMDRKPVVLLESEAISTLVEQRQVVEIYRMIRAELDRIALDQEESRTLLADLANDYDRDIEERDRDGGQEHVAEE
jgi:transcriptional regulator with XRE-family HTH domain